MKKKGAGKQSMQEDKKLAKIIREAQEQPGIADLMALMDQSQELDALSREHRESTVATEVVSATATTQ